MDGWAGWMTGRMDGWHHIIILYNVKAEKLL
jgi:hypothetical protein